MDINNTFKEIAQYRMLKAEAEAELERLENEVKEYMKELELDELKGDEHKATYKVVESMKFNSSLFKKEHADMYEAFKTPSRSMRFTFN